MATPSSERSGTFQNELTFFLEGAGTSPAGFVCFREMTFLYFKDIEKSFVFAEKFNFEKISIWIELQAFVQILVEFTVFVDH